MTDRPIIFSGPMIQALLAGRKTQTRRMIKPQPLLAAHHEPVRAERRGERRWVWMTHTDRPDYQFATGDWVCPYAAGDQLYVREAWQAWKDFDNAKAEDLPAPMRERINYLADGNTWDARRRPSIHMPRWASRLTLTVTDVRVQRLQDISEKNAVAEGVKGDQSQNIRKWGYEQHARMAFADIWEGLHEPGSWDKNPWVAALTFEVHRANIDALPPAPTTDNGERDDG